MTAAGVLESAAAEGLIISLSPPGDLDVTGGPESLDRWLPLLRQYKAGIIELLSGEQDGVVEPPHPDWCRADCKHLRQVELDDLPPVTACYHWQSPTSWTWARLDRLDACPLTTSRHRRRWHPRQCRRPPAPRSSACPCGGRHAPNDGWDLVDAFLSSRQLSDQKSKTATNATHTIQRVTICRI